MIEALLLDLSGVLYEGDDLVPGAPEAIAAARDSGLVIRYVTNTSQHDRASILARLRAFGFELADNELFTAVDAAKSWLAQRGMRPYCVVHENIRDEFDAGDEDSADAVLIADAAEGFTYDRLNRALRLCVAGAPLLGVGYNRYYSRDGQLWLDAGAFVRAVEFAAGVEAVIVGKPSTDFFDQVVASTGVAAANALMVGDDVHGDVEGALAAGLQACLVRTGKYRKGDEALVAGDFALVDSVVAAVALARAEGH